MRDRFVIEISMGGIKDFRKILNDCARSKVHFVVLVCTVVTHSAVLFVVYFVGGG